MKTWDEYRRHLARNVFGFLRSSTGGGSFVLRGDRSSIGEDAVLRPREWFEDFDQYHRSEYLAEVAIASETLSNRSKRDLAPLAERLRAVVSSSTHVSPSVFRQLDELSDELQNQSGDIRAAAESQLRVSLNTQVNADRGFLDDLARVIDEMRAEFDAASDNDDEEVVDEDEDVAASTEAGETTRTGASPRWKPAK